MTYTFENNRLYADGKLIFEAPSEIDACLKNSFNETAVIVYDAYVFMEDAPILAQTKVDDASVHEKINQNILCIDKDGNVLWRIEKTSDYPYPFSQLFEKNGELWAYRADRQECSIDRKTGKVLKWELAL